MSLETFHDAVRAWFTRELGAPTEPQREAWPCIARGEDTLVAAPTGSGKTLAAFLSAIDGLVREGLAGQLVDETRVLYVSPLKALGNDIQRNLEAPLAAIARELEATGHSAVPIRTMVRSGDTPSRDRARMMARPPHIVVTTPESFYILLTSEGGRRMLRTVRTVIVDEVHAMIGDKRGSHLSLSLSRLDALAGRRVQRIGLSATQKPIERVARFLMGRDANGEPRPATIVDSGHFRARDLAVEVPRSPLEAVMAGEVWNEVYDRVAELVRTHRTTLVFVNTRRVAERVSRCLGERLGPEKVGCHHGSLSREQRLEAEQRLKSGEYAVLVATASLELGIDVGSIDLVCQIGSTRSIASFLQRVGRAGHSHSAVSKGRLFPTTRDDLVECVALLDAARRGELDAVSVPVGPLDILAQQIVAAASAEEWDEQALYELVRTADPYAGLTRETFDETVRMLAEGFSTRRGRRAARIHHDPVNGKIRPRKGSRLVAITSGGAIPDMADYEVIQDPTGHRVGTVNEDFAIESMAGDVFQLGNASWKILRVTPGVVRVEDARGQPPTIPFWLGEAPGRTAELSAAVSRVRGAVDAALGPELPGDLDAAERALIEATGASPEAAHQVVEYLAAGRAALAAMPTEGTLVLERFFDESGGMQLVVHSPRGSRLNRAFGLALRKRFCQRFDFELQAAATDDAIVLSLGPTHSFPLEEVFGYLRAETARELLVKAVVLAPMFGTRFRWNASRALAILRSRGGKRVPPRLQRMDAEDLTAVVFPDQVACQENAQGPLEIPDHPLVRQTLEDCLTEAMDVRSLEAFLGAMARGELRLVARDTTEPSPFAQEILTARPYAFLDDAPLEERRTQAVYARRYLDPRAAADIGALDPAAIDRVRGEAWPSTGSVDEVAEALSLLGYATEREVATEGFAEHLPCLFGEGRALRIVAPGGRVLHVAAERWEEVRAAFGDPEVAPQPRSRSNGAPPPVPEPEAAIVEILRGRLESLGPTTAHALSMESGLALASVEAALAALEAEGFVLRGRFTAGASSLEWCERRLLARIHRYTLGRLRSEIEPVPAADYMRFLIAWQRAGDEGRVRGVDGLAAVLAALEGYEAPAAAWEAEILPARVDGYAPALLDALCTSGRVAWLRVPPADGAAQRTGPVRQTPIVLVSRANIDLFRRPPRPGAPVAVGDTLGGGTAGGRPQGGSRPPESISPHAASVLAHLTERGASFFDDLLRGARLSRAEAEAGLAELVVYGLVTSDSFAGLRALLVPAHRRGAEGRSRRFAAPGLEDGGRWSVVGAEADPPADLAERVARIFLARYGVVVRRVVEREASRVPWRDLVRVYRRLEARGDIRGGRFVGGFTGEQYALPAAVEALRSARRAARSGQLASFSAADPLNLSGVVTPGDRVPAITKNRVLYRDGVVAAHKVGARVEVLPGAGEGDEALARALVRTGSAVSAVSPSVSAAAAPPAPAAPPA